MTGNELLRRLSRLGRQRGVAVRFEEERGKGSHGTVSFGNRFTVLKDRRAENPARLAACYVAPTGPQRERTRDRRSTLWLQIVTSLLRGWCQMRRAATSYAFQT